MTEIDNQRNGLEEDAKEEFWINALNTGEAFYKRYGSWVDNKAWNGEPLKEFMELPEKIRYAWIMASLGKTKHC